MLEGIRYFFTLNNVHCTVCVHTPQSGGGSCVIYHLDISESTTNDRIRVLVTEWHLLCQTIAIN